jgi:hypothetical protein
MVVQRLDQPDLAVPDLRAFELLLRTILLAVRSASSSQTHGVL